ncbi:MAG: hypothetical protein JWO69_1435, partial [Thermoleophilia bacterium]|nr:hypothetical protein [Thermoleophilia bacterium]
MLPAPAQAVPGPVRVPVRPEAQGRAVRLARRPPEVARALAVPSERVPPPAVRAGPPAL